MVTNIFKTIPLSSFLRTVYRAFAGYKKRIAALTLLGFASGLLEGIGINAFIPIFSFIAGGEKSADAVSVALEKGFLFFHIPFGLPYLLGFVCLLFILRAAAIIITNYITIRISADYEERTRRDLFEKTLGADWPYLLKERLGHLETVIMTNVQYSELLLSHFASVIIIVTSLAMYIAVALSISAPITLAALLFGALVLFFLKPLVVRMKRLAGNMEVMNRQISHHINEHVLGMKTVKTMLVSDFVVAVGGNFFRMLKELRVKVSLIKIIPDALLQPVGLLFIVGVFAFTYKTPGFNVAALGAVIYLIQRMFVYVSQLQNHFNVIVEAFPYLLGVLGTKEAAEAHKEGGSGTRAFSFNSAIAFRDIEFSYPGSKHGLHGVSFSIKKGETLGVIGPSGSGKTTLADVALRLLVSSRGTITVDGRISDEIRLSDWRRKVGYVSQDIFLANDTIRNNIRFHDDSITDEEVTAAAKLAHAAEFIEASPQKFETMVGERGTALSAGQRQRIIVARVLARKPSFLILDEATSALDTVSEAAIQKVIEELKGKMTVLIIAHRLSTLSKADRLIVLERGTIIEEGTPAELLARKGSYFAAVYHLAA